MQATAPAMAVLPEDELARSVGGFCRCEALQAFREKEPKVAVERSEGQTVAPIHRPRGKKAVELSQRPPCPWTLDPASSACPFLTSERSRRPPPASSPRVSSPFSPCSPRLLPPRRPPRHGHPPGPPCGTLSSLSTRAARPAGAVDEPCSAARVSHRSFPLAPTFSSPSSTPSSRRFKTMACLPITAARL